MLNHSTSVSLFWKNSLKKLLMLLIKWMLFNSKLLKVIFLEFGLFVRSKYLLFCSIVQLRGFQNLYIAFFAICVVYIQLFYLPELAAEFVMVVINAAANLFQCADIFPKKLDTLRNHVDIEFAYKGMYRLIVCPECNTLYKPETAQYAPICTSKKFGVICGAVLIQNLVPGARKMYGNLVAPFNNIQHALTLMFARDGFESLIEVWRGRTRHQDTMYDIYDGQLWSEFKDKDGQIFTEQYRSLMLTLNVD